MLYISYTWWLEDGDAHAAAKLTIDGITTDKQYFVLAENPVGRAVLSVPLTVYDPSAQLSIIIISNILDIVPAHIIIHTIFFQMILVLIRQQV